MISIGRYIGVITENGISTTMNGKMYANIIFQIEGDLTDCRIWLTDKCLYSGVAQKQLLKCGFDYNKRELSELGESRLLAGNKVAVIIAENEYNGKTSLQCNIDMGSVDKDQLKKVQDALRKVKVEDESAITDEDIPF